MNYKKTFFKVGVFLLLASSSGLLFIFWTLVDRSVPFFVGPALPKIFFGLVFGLIVGAAFIFSEQLVLFYKKNKTNLAVLGAVILVLYVIADGAIIEYNKNNLPYIADEELGWVPNPRLNPPSQGFREEAIDLDELETDRLMYSLGDSFAFLGYEENFLKILDDASPNHDLINLGVSGYSPNQYYKILKRFAEQKKPSFVILNYYVGNDVVNTSNEGFFENFGLIKSVERVARQIQFAFNAAAKANAERTILEEKLFLHTENSNFYYAKKEYSPEVETQAVEALNDLQKIIDYTRERDIGLVFVIIPDRYQLEPDLVDRLAEVYDLNLNEYDIYKVSDRLKDFLDVNDVLYIDLIPAFAAAQKEKDLYIKYDTHWGPEGNLLAVYEIAARLQEDEFREFFYPTSTPAL